MSSGCMVSAACATSIPLVSAPSACPSRKTTTARFRRRTLSCRASGGGGQGNNDGLLWLPRRDMMLSSGVAAGLAWYPGVAYGDDTKCDKPDSVDGKNVQCTDPAAGEMPCPPLSPSDPVPFTPAKAVTRVRQPVHLLSDEKKENYKKAVAMMKALNDTDPTNPLNFKNQAAIHQAYCDAHYRYNTKQPFDVHFSWLFAPWHRMYIYFYERALGQLIGDDTFALPYWSWDVPEGMVVPPLFKDDPRFNSLYDANRNPDNVDALVDLDYINNRRNNPQPPIPFNGPKDDKYMELVNKNLCTVYTQEIKSGTRAEIILGEIFCTADAGAGSTGGTGYLESMAHNAMHVWVGKAGPKDPTDCTAETGGVPNHLRGGYACTYDLGFLGRAGYDPLFYSHHSNVDRMWHLWSTRFGGKDGIKFQNPELDKIWKDTTFVFYDDVHNPKKVSIKFSDVLDISNLGYTFDPSYDKDLPWLSCKMTPLVPHGKDAQPKLRTKALKVGPTFPLDLTKGQVVELTDVAVPDKDPAGKKELLLVIDGIEFDPQQNNKFDVAINVPKDKALQVGPQHREYAGTFTSVPGSGSGTGTTRKSKVTLCITGVLNDIDAQDDKTVDIVIVPRSNAKVTLKVRPTIKYQN